MGIGSGAGVPWTAESEWLALGFCWKWVVYDTFYGLLYPQKTSVYTTLNPCQFCPIAYLLFQPFSFWGRLISFFMEGVASKKRLSVSHGFGCNMSNHRDSQEMNVIQGLSSSPECVMWFQAAHEKMLWWAGMNRSSKRPCRLFLRYGVCAYRWIFQ